MNILLTGGTGLIGQALIRALTQEHQLLVITRTPNKHASQNDKDNISYIADLALVDFAELDVILNLAGEPIVNKRWTDEQKERLCDSRWSMTQALVDKIEASNTKANLRFISGSAVGFYGRQDQRPINESYASPYPEFSHMLCQRWEQIALSTEKASTALLRTGIVLSKRGGALDKMLLPFKLGLGGRIGDGSQMMPWIHIDDMINAIVFLIEHPDLQGPFNMTAPEPVTNHEFSKTLAKRLKRPCILPMPEFALRMLMGEMADLLVYGQNAIPQRLMDYGFEFRHPKLNHALADLL
jgi:uncharacterized protein (TIGR01777 family)